MRVLAALLIAILLFLSGVLVAEAQGKRITVAADGILVETGLDRHMMPRFSLKHRIGIDVVPLAALEEADLAIGPKEAVPGGRPAMSRDGVVFVVKALNDSEETARFLDWLLSDVGKRTVEGFAPAAGPAFSGATDIQVASTESVFEGDSGQGAKLSLALCGRCHVIGEINRMNGIGSTPSFGVLRTMGDWEDRFRSFYVLKPHPAFTQVEDVTAPFDETRPSPIEPVTMTLDDLEAILAFVADIVPADLGNPIQHQ